MNGSPALLSPRGLRLVLCRSESRVDNAAWQRSALAHRSPSLRNRSRQRRISLRMVLASHVEKEGGLCRCLLGTLLDIIETHLTRK